MAKRSKKEIAKRARAVDKYYSQTTKPVEGKLGMKISLFVVVLSIILLMFFVYDYLDWWRDSQEAIKSSPEIEDPPLPKAPEASDLGLITCVDLGCPEGTMYTGSANSNLYHGCNCFYAKAIFPENRVCFNSAEEAEFSGYKAGSCL